MMWRIFDFVLTTLSLMDLDKRNEFELVFHMTNSVENFFLWFKMLIPFVLLSQPQHIWYSFKQGTIWRYHTYLFVLFLIWVFISSFKIVPIDWSHKSAIHQASVAPVLAADDNSCQDLTMPSQQVGQAGAAWDNIKQDCLTWGERPVVRHSIRRGQKGLPISMGHKAASICHS